MCNAARELPHRFHLLRLPQRLLRGAPETGLDFQFGLLRGQFIDELAHRTHKIRKCGRGGREADGDERIEPAFEPRGFYRPLEEQSLLDRSEFVNPAAECIHQFGARTQIDFLPHVLTGTAFSFGEHDFQSRQPRSRRIRRQDQFFLLTRVVANQRRQLVDVSDNLARSTAVAVQVPLVFADDVAALARFGIDHFGH